MTKRKKNIMTSNNFQNTTQKLKIERQQPGLKPLVNSVFRKYEILVSRTVVQDYSNRMLRQLILQYGPSCLSIRPLS
jgi:hypothetical protein